MYHSTTSGRALSLALFSLPFFSSTGSLDLTFGSNGTGIVTEAIGRSNTLKCIAILPDDSIIGVGKVTVISSASGIARFTPNGILDTSYNSTGYAQLSVGPQTTMQAVVIQPDSKAVIAGYVLDNPTKSVIARYDTTGMLDTSFNSTGYVVANIANGSSIQAVCLQPDGKIIVGGTAGQGTPSFFVARYNSDGSVDTSFGIDGIAQVYPGYVSSIHALCIQPDGKILAAGYAWNFNTDVFALARFNSDGTIDEAFGTDGTVTTQIGASSQAQAMIIQPDGKIILGGHTTSNYIHYQFALARYDSTGALDTTFNTTGTVITAINYSSGVYALSLQQDGNILAGGYDFGARYTTFALARYLPSGILDGSFGTAGIALTEIGASAQINSLAFQSDGKIIAAGFSDTNAALTRYLA